MSLFWDKRKAEIIVEETRENALWKIADSPILADIEQIITIHLNAIKKLKGQAFFDSIAEFQHFTGRIMPMVNTPSRKCLFRSSFINAVDHCTEYAESKKTLSQKQDVYDFYMNTVRQNLKYDLLMRLIYGAAELGVKQFDITLPIFYYENGIRKIFNFESEPRRFDIEKTCFISAPDMLARLLRLLDAESDIETVANSTVYYTQMDIGFAQGDNNHRIAKKNLIGGQVDARVCDTTKWYPFIDTDGYWWTDSKTGKKIDNVIDFRVAILYELSRRKFQLC